MKKYRTHILLFLASVLTTTLAGAEWIYGKAFLNGEMGMDHFKEGFKFSIPFLLFLTTHEFGHYFAAQWKKIKVTLPYYIPGWIGIIMSIGTFGAFIRIKDPVYSRKDFFDIGIAGPLAGAVVALVCLYFGFQYMPGDEYIYGIHPEYQSYPGDYRELLDKNASAFEAITLGKSMLYSFMENTFGNPDLLPHPYELSHYPLILAGFLGLLFTAINLLPIGQLDGGHILYGLVGPKAFRVISPSALVLLVGYSGLGMFQVQEWAAGADYLLYLQFFLYVYFVYLCFSKIFTNRTSNWILTLAVVLCQLLLTQWQPGIMGYPGFLAFGFLIGRVLGVYHPPTFDVGPLGWGRQILGWLAMLLFVLCFIPYPIS
ncbi:peptidase M50 [Leadbetterella byssophila DSM 17132]|uniref:Peptidase M50 n=1 Tax=Leadbetterella byssophila (strain DSM 17132 / JCM 16389 / KACC 11308 / NBRC 106382 / 4M15) TaxID=649349 RepID=E4RVB1_LEAB4|nr:site-2 protease family protein [Leadbetterella byssophila]ADQ16097.1 peptidase M50 [Leadbetterella byssophila DSM 17132]